MARISDTFTRNYTNQGGEQMLNLAHGGQWGEQIRPEALVNSTLYVRQNIIGVLLESPYGFDYAKNPSAYHRSLKAIMELHSREISGLNSTLNVDVVQQDSSGAGEQISAVSDVKREVSTPTHSMVELYNKPITTFWNSFITDYMLDPETKMPNILVYATTRPTDMLMDFNSFTMLYWEPDPTYSFPIHAWLCRNMMPNGSGPQIQGSSNRTAAKEDLVIEMTFTAHTEQNAGVMQLAASLMAKMKSSASTPYQRPAGYDDVSPKVRAISDTGYLENMESAKQAAITQ